jgi:hypothetical protein
MSAILLTAAQPSPEATLVAPESNPTDMDDDRSENSYKDLADATADDLANHSIDGDDDDDGAPIGFRFLKGTFFPYLKGHIVKDSVDSSSEYAKRVFFKNGCMVEEPYMPGSDESYSDESDADKPENKKRAIEEVQDEEDDDDEPLAKAAKIACRTRCGRVMGEDWDGNGQCACDVCLGYLDSQQSQEPHSQEGAAAEA